MNVCRGCQLPIMPTGRQGRPRRWCTTCRPDGERAPRPTTRTARATRMRWQIGRQVDLSDDTLRTLYAAAALHTSCLAEQTLLVVQCVLAGKDADWLEVQHARRKYMTFNPLPDTLGLFPKEDP